MAATAFDADYSDVLFTFIQWEESLQADIEKHCFRQSIPLMDSKNHGIKAWKRMKQFLSLPYI